MYRSRNRVLWTAVAAALLVALAVPVPSAGVSAQGGSAPPEGAFNFVPLSRFGETTHRAVEASGGVLYAIKGGKLEIRANSATAEVLAAGLDAPGIDVYPYGNGVMLLRPDGFAWFDCSVPADPVLLGTFRYRPGVMIRGFFASGGYAYFSYESEWGGRGTKVVSLADPSELRYVAYSDLAFDDLHGDVRSGHAYVRTDNGFKTVSLASPKAPVVVKEYASVAKAGDVAVSGSHLYLAHGDTADWAKAKGMRVFSLANPASPALVADRPTSAPMIDVALSATHAWCGDAAGTLFRYSVATPSAPAIEAGTVAAGSPVRRLAASGGFAHAVAGDDRGGESALLTVDGTVPGAMTLAGTVRMSAGYAGMYAEAGRVFAATARGFEAWDVTDPAGPTRLAAYDHGSAIVASDVRLLGNTAYVAAGDSLLAVRDAGTAPALASEWTSAGVGLKRLEVADGLLFAASAKGLLVFDLTAPNHPSLLGAHSTFSSGMEAGLSAQPHAPPAAGPVTDLAVSPAPDRRVWVAMDTPDEGYSVVIEIDVSRPASPVRLAEHGVPGDVVVLDRGAWGGHQTLYAGYSREWGSGVKIFDVGTRGWLWYKGGQESGVDGSRDLATSACVTDTVFAVGPAALRAIDSQVFKAPYLSGFHTANGSRVAAAEDVVFVSDPSEGLAALRYSAGTRRSFGMTRYDTAVSLSKDFASSEWVVIATGRSFPDAVSAVPLAYALNAPILLADGGVLPGSAAEEIRRLGATKAVVIGGQKAVPDTVIDALVAAGIPRGSIQRVHGTDRYGTSKAIALKLKAVKGGGDIPLAFCASGANYPDALAAGGAAAKLGAPILLVKPGEMPAATKEALDELDCTDTVILGGEKAVGYWAEGKLPSPERVSGGSRYQTAKNVADWALQPGNGTGMKSDAVFVATGRKFPDALASGVVAARHDGVTLLVDGYIPDPTAGFFRDRAGQVLAVRIIGGSGAVSADTEWAIERLAFGFK